MKSEDFAMQELEKQRRLDSGIKVEADGGKPTLNFMIAGEAPVVMTKACELMIKELTLLAWKHADNNRRKTLQRADVHAAVGDSEIYDFLIDLVPRIAPSTINLTIPPPTRQEEVSQQSALTNESQHHHQQENYVAGAMMMATAGADLNHLQQQLYLPVNIPNGVNKDERITANNLTADLEEHKTGQDEERVISEPLQWEDVGAAESIE